MAVNSDALFADESFLAGLDPQQRAHALDGLDRLNAIVPLAARQAALPAKCREMHRLILWHWAQQGRPPALADLAKTFPDTDIDAALQRLYADDLVVAQPSRQAIEGAYPFTLEAREHQVAIGAVRVHAMCAVDALSVSAMLNRPTRVHSRCRVTGRVVELDQDGPRLSRIEGLHVGVHWRNPEAGTCTAHSLCREMVFLLGGAAVEQWRAEAPDLRLIYTPEQALAFGALFFRPLLAPAAAAG